LIRVEGKDVLTELRELASPRRAALLLVDMQQDFVAVIVGGCTTEGCVESTARDAMFCDHYVIIAEDCVGSDDKEQHDASMLLMRHRFDMATAAAIQDVWAAEPAAG
jgi:nicotinamidase-related amidase